MRRRKRKKTEIKRVNNLQKKTEKHIKKIKRLKIERWKNKIKEFLQLIFVLIVTFHIIVSYQLTKGLCFYYGVPAKGVVVGNYYIYLGRRDRLVGRCYEFSHNGKYYTGVKYSLKEQLDDTIDIVYIKYCPYLNVAMGTYSDKAQKKIIQRNKEQDLIK